MDHSSVLSLGNPPLTGHFEKDLKFLQRFLLLFNQSCPIKRIDLKWAEEGPSGRAALRAQRLSTEDALAGHCGSLLSCDGVPEPVFCNLIHDHGRHEEESCAISDRDAEMRARQSLKPEVYRCHAGLVDIAVPVIAGGQYIATLLAGEVLQAITSHCPLQARVGSGAPKSEWREIADSYHEARIALASYTGSIAVYQPCSAANEEVFAAVGRICRSIAERRLGDARVQVLELPVLISQPTNGNANRLEAQRHLLIYALDAIQYTTREQGAGTPTQDDAFGASALSRASTPFELQMKFVEVAESVLDSIRNLFVGRPQMLVDRAAQLIEANLTDPATAPSISIRSIASTVGISADHLSRLFKKATGLTFERFLILRRVEAARRLLLEPLAGFAEISDRLGFSDPAYFARVFRKMTGCSPSAYRNNPMTLEGPLPDRLNGAAHPRS